MSPTNTGRYAILFRRENEDEDDFEHVFLCGSAESAGENLASLQRDEHATDAELWILYPATADERSLFRTKARQRAEEHRARKELASEILHLERMVALGHENLRKWRCDLDALLPDLTPKALERREAKYREGVASCRAQQEKLATLRVKL